MRIRCVLLRRHLALALALTLALVTTVEIQIADVHDGHSVLSAPETDLSESGGKTPPTGPASNHTAHVDHCAHSHVAPPALKDPADQSEGRASRVENLSSLALNGETIAPPVPPPVA